MGSGWHEHKPPRKLDTQGSHRSVRVVPGLALSEEHKTDQTGCWPTLLLLLLSCMRQPRAPFALCLAKGHCSQEVTAFLGQLTPRPSGTPPSSPLPNKPLSRRDVSDPGIPSTHTESLGEPRRVMTPQELHAERDPAPTLPAMTSSGTMIGPTWSPGGKRGQKTPCVRKRCKNPPSYKNSTPFS